MVEESLGGKSGGERYMVEKSVGAMGERPWVESRWVKSTWVKSLLVNSIWGKI